MKERWKRAALILIPLLVTGGIGARQWRTMQTNVEKLPSAPARKGEFLVMIRCRGEVVAGRSVQLTAPLNVPSLQIVWLAPSGGAVRDGEPVIRFDPSAVRQQQVEKEAALRQAQAALEQAEAEAQIREEQDKRDLSAAGYQVERAKIEVSKQEIVSVLQGEESKIDLGLAQEKLRVQGAGANLHKASDNAKMASLRRVRDQAAAEVEITKRRMERMEIKTPLSGVIVYMSNYSQGWMNAKPFKIGDQVWAGSVIAEIPDLNTLELKAKLEEIDRGKIAPGQQVRIVADPFPEKSFTGTLERVSPLTEQSFEWPPTRSFRASAPIRNADPRLRPGMNGRLDIIVDRIPNAISVPVKALFTKAGKPVVYIAEPAGYRPAWVEVVARNVDEVAVKGLPEGATVALAEPEARK